MNENEYNINVFGFSDKNELWDAIMLILEHNAELETSNAISGNVNNEKRIHLCGRAEATRDIINLLKSEREKALEYKKSEII
jgi:hypothetical protein